MENPNNVRYVKEGKIQERKKENKVNPGHHGPRDGFLTVKIQSTNDTLKIEESKRKKSKSRRPKNTMWSTWKVRDN